MSRYNTGVLPLTHVAERERPRSQSLIKAKISFYQNLVISYTLTKVNYKCQLDNRVFLVTCNTMPYFQLRIIGRYFLSISCCLLLVANLEWIKYGFPCSLWISDFCKTVLQSRVWNPNLFLQVSSSLCKICTNVSNSVFANMGLTRSN